MSPTVNTCELVLSGKLSARKFCKDAGFADELVPLLHDLKGAHDRIVDKRVQKRCKAIVAAFRKGTLSKRDAARMLRMSEQAVYELLSWEPT